MKILTQNEIDKKILDAGRVWDIASGKEIEKSLVNAIFTGKGYKPAGRFVWVSPNNNVEDPTIIDSKYNVVIFADDVLEYYEYPENGATFEMCEEYFDYILYTREMLEDAFKTFCENHPEELTEYFERFYDAPIAKTLRDRVKEAPGLFANACLTVLNNDSILFECFARYVIYVFFPKDVKNKTIDWDIARPLYLFNSYGAFKIDK